MDFLTRVGTCDLFRIPFFESAEKRLEARKRETFWMTVSVDPEVRGWEAPDLSEMPHFAVNDSAAFRVSRRLHTFVFWLVR